MNIIITIPAYNEAWNIEKTLLEIRDVMKNSDLGPYKTLVQDDASEDDTFLLAKKNADYAFRNSKHCGLAETFRQEMKNCLDLGADIIVHMDADGQYPAKYIPDLVRKAQQGYDLVIGSRFLNGMNYGNGTWRGLQNILFSKWASGISGAAITDITSGFRAMNRRTASLISIRSQFTYTYEQYMQAVYRGLTIFEIPIEGQKTRKSRLVKGFSLYARNVLSDFIKHHRNWRRGD